MEQQGGHFWRPISDELAELVIAQLRLEENLLKKLLAEIKEK